MVDVKTGRVLPEDDPAMVKILEIWAATTLNERQAYHRVMCLNSRDPLDLFFVRGIVARFEDKAN